jgi:tRNA C32,U32 (ribose-2'-O)-methylase TrmJ
MKKIRQLLKRAYPSNAEVTMLHGMVSQMKWALKSGKFSQMATPSDGADENQE